MGLIGEMRNRKKRRKPLGLHIGSASVRVLELSLCNGSYRVESCALEALPPNAVIEGNISDVEGVGEALKRALARSGSRASRAVLAVEGPAVIARTVALEASLADTDILGRIVADADRYIPHPLEDVAFDFEVQGLSERHPAQAEVLLVRLPQGCGRPALCRRARRPSRTRCRRAGGPGCRTPVRIAGNRSSAGRRASLWSRLPTSAQPRQPCGFWLMDGWYSAARNPWRPSARGRLSRNAARSRFMRPNAPSGGGVCRTGFAGSVVRPFNETLPGTLRAPCGFFYSSTHYSAVDHVLLIGGLAAAEGLAAELQNRLEAPATVGDPFAGMSTSPLVDADSLAVDASALALCCGLAMRSVE